MLIYHLFEAMKPYLNALRLSVLYWLQKDQQDHNADNNNLDDQQYNYVLFDLIVFLHFNRITSNISAIVSFLANQIMRYLDEESKDKLTNLLQEDDEIGIATFLGQLMSEYGANIHNEAFENRNPVMDFTGLADCTCRTYSRGSFDDDVDYCLCDIVSNSIYDLDECDEVFQMFQEYLYMLLERAYDMIPEIIARISKQ